MYKGAASAAVGKAATLDVGKDLLRAYLPFETGSAAAAVDRQLASLLPGLQRQMTGAGEKGNVKGSCLVVVHLELLLDVANAVGR